ncbi:S-layer homology domain-containing protein [Cohnella fermenti]|uniref:SLH domain-containing protein n=1 Tax=Cohnella fermenti TaxID=2565925 RepID=A0A4S4C616_9BACL|nr:S-layer homology domain-containing protein [Cohnella fermenti]THF83225.1 hypothetical protein E6C55_05055 [Cohnella fermenti]
MRSGKTGFAGVKKRGALVCLLVVSLLLGLVQPGIGPRGGAAASGATLSGSNLAASDIAGHWAEETMARWQSLGLINGFADGSLRPDQTITRIEFVALANRLFAYKGTAAVDFADVPGGAWFASEVKAAVGAGYVSGFPDGTFKPNQALSRVEAAVMLAKLVPVLERDGANSLDAFTDRDSVPAYGRASLGALIGSGYVKGFADRTVRPGQKLTRAEAVVLLDRIVKGSAAEASGGGAKLSALVLTEPGTYGPETGTFAVAGDLVVDVPGVTLRHVVVKGNLTIGEAVGEGDVFLDHVTVNGSTSIQGGGENSVHIDDSDLGTVVIEKKDGRIRIVVGGTTVIEQMDVKTDASIEADGAAAGAIEGIEITAAGEVVLSGKFASVTVSSDVKLTVGTGSIERLIVAEGVGGSAIALNEGVKVASMELHGTASVSGAGEIAKALLDAPNIEFETKPGAVETTDRAGASAGTAGGSSGSGGADGGGSSGGGTGGTGGGGTGGTGGGDTPQTTDVGVEAGEASLSGFRLTLSPAVPGLTASAITLADSSGQAVAIASAATLTSGSTYRVVATLREGEAYTVRLTLSGYNFGGAVAFSVPAAPPQEVAVTASARDIGSTGFLVTLSPAVAGLTAANFSLSKLGSAEAIEAAEAVSADNGATYSVAAALEEGATYSLAIASSGYGFGSPLTVFVPVTDPEIVSVTSTVYGVGANGFTVLLSSPVAGLTADNFRLTDDSGATVAVAGTSEAAEGSSYVLAAALEAGIVYTLEIAKTGYSFGASPSFSLPAEQAIVVTPTASNVSVNGFLLAMDKTVADLDALNFDLQSEDGQEISIDMLSAVRGTNQYEVWAALAKNKEYSLSLNKEGYVFSEPASVRVQVVEVPATVDWATRGAFKLTFASAVYGLTSAQFALTDPNGQAVDIQSFQLAADAKSVVVTADLNATGSYAYRFETDDAKHSEGEIEVPEAVAVGKYTTFEGYSGSYTGLAVHFEKSVPGLTESAFQLTNSSGSQLALDSAQSADGGSTYILATSGLNSGGTPFKLGIAADGYDFGEPATLVNPTLNLWNAGHVPTQFMAGLNPYVADLTKENFTAKDASGNDVGIVDAYYDGSYHLYIVSFNGSGGNDYWVSVHVDGYDFGAPKLIHVYSQSDIGEVSYNGFTLALVPSVLINTQYGFHLTNTSGESVAIQSVDNVDGVGGTYRINARLAPGGYFLNVDANLDSNGFYVSVPLIATLSVDQVTNKGLTAKLNYAVDNLDETSFGLTNADTGEQVSIASAVTDDQGSTYRLAASLPAGNYRLTLPGHLPEDGVAFAVGDVTDAGATAVSGISAAGFTLTFENAVPGLLPANLDIRDEQNNKLGGVKLTTSDSGLSYRVSVALTTGATYTVKLQKDYIVFDSPLAVHVKPVIKGTVTDVTNAGKLILTFDKAFPELQNYLGLSITDADGLVYMPNYFETSDQGVSYEIRVPNNGLKPGVVYTIKLDHELYAMEPVSFTIPGIVEVAEANTSGLKVRFDVPVTGLTKANFVIKSSTGESFVVSSAATDDGGASYTIAAALTAGKKYTLQYKPNDLKLSVEPVPFVVSKLVTAALGEISQAGMKVTFSSKVPELQPLQLVLTQDGNRLSTDSYSLQSTDGGLTYQIAFNSVYPGYVYMLDLAREEYKLAAPVPFKVPAGKTLKLYSTTATQIIVDAGVTGLTEDQFALYNAKGQKVAVTVTQNDSAASFYVLTGAFDINQKYTLKVTHPDYTFAPLTVGFKIEVAAFAFGSQTGFKLLLWPGVEGLEPSDFTVTDDQGGTATVTDIQTSDSGWTYYAKVPLVSGKKYQVAIADKGPYAFQFSSNTSISLNTNGASVDRLTLKGFRLIFNTPVYLYDNDVRLIDEDGQEVGIRSFYSSDGGLSFAVEATLEADKNYTLAFDKFGYDFGGDIPLAVRSVQTTFEGMESGNNNAFTLSFDQAVPGLKPSDFTIMRYGQRAPLPVLDATTEDNGYTYRIESSFWGAETVTVLPSKNGYDFGDALPILVPIIVSPAVLRTGANYVDIGFNPTVLGLNAADFIVKDEDGHSLALTSAESFDGGQSYRLSGPFVGGETYTVAPQHTGYDFGSEGLAAQLARAVTSEAAAIDETGLTVLLNPGVEGLAASSFALRDASYQPVPIQAVEELSDGKAYRISAELAAGATYSLTVTAAGYEFDSPATVKVPIPVGFTFEGVSPVGLTVNFGNWAIPLTAADFALTDEEGQSIAVDSASPINGGLGYILEAELPYDHTYSLSVTADGYDFGTGLSFYVKEPAAAAVQNATQTGFTLSLDHAVKSLTAANLSLKDSLGNPIAIDSLTTANAGLSYRADVTLLGGGSYTLSLASSKVEFGSSLSFEAQMMVELELTNLASDRIGIRFSEPLPDLEPSSIKVVSDDGTVIPVGSLSRQSNNQEFTARFSQAYLESGIVYWLSIEGTSRAVEGPIELVMPISASSTVTGVSDSGIKILLSRSDVELLPADIELLTSAGDTVRVSSVVAGETAGAFAVQAALAQGATYSLRIDKYTYDFGTAKSVYVPYLVSAKVASIHEGGLTVSLSMPVTDLNVKLIDAATGSDYVGRLTTNDNGLTYVIEAAVSYNKDFTLKLGKSGYDLGSDIPVNNVSAPPQVATAVTGADGKSITLTFDKQLNWTEERAVFSVKINSQWQSDVLSRLGTDKRQIVLTWSGKVIDENSTVSVASSSVNRVNAVNKTFMAPFEEVAVTNVSTLMGMIQSYVYRDDIENPAAYPAQVLHGQYGLTAIETARKLQEGGFRNALLFRTVILEYRLEGVEIAKLLYALNADPQTIFEAYGSKHLDDQAYTVVKQLIEAGYTYVEYGAVLRKMGFSSRSAAIVLYQAGASATDIVRVLRNSFDETSGSSASLARIGSYGANELAVGIRAAYGLDIPDVVQALAGGGLPVGDIAAAVQSLYGIDAVTNASLLSGAGFDASAIGAALAQLYSYDSVDDALDVYLGAGFSGADSYAILRSEYPREAIASGLLDRDFSAREVGEAVRLAADGARVIIAAMKGEGDSDTAIAQLVKDIWVISGTSLAAILPEFAANGYTFEQRAVLLREEFDADVAEAASAIIASESYSSQKGIYKVILAGGYEPAKVMYIFLKNGVSRYEAYRQFKEAGVTTADALKSVYDALAQSGTSFGLEDALLVILRDYSRPATALEAISAIKTVFAGDENVDLSAVGLARAAGNYWAKLEIAAAIKSQLGLTLKEFVELEGSNGFEKFGCPCSALTVVREAPYLFSGVTIQDLTTAMSVSSAYSLSDVVLANFELQDTRNGRDRNTAAPYVLASLKNSGYAFEDVAAEFDRLGLSRWIDAFHNNGIAASDVAAYLKSKSATAAETTARLEPYPLKDRALVLREIYALDSAEAIATLVANTNEDDEDIGRAISWAYGGDPIALWVQTLRSQGGTATSVMNSILARYPSYRDAGTIGPILLNAGFSQEDILEAMITIAYRYYGVVQLKDTIRVLQSLFSQQQVTIGQLLKSASLTTPQSGIDFLSYAGYKMGDIAGSLKDYYGLTAGEASALLVEKYPNDKKAIVSVLASLYGQDLSATMAESLEAAGITTAESALDYLRYEGFGIQELAVLFKDRFGWTAGQTGAAFNQRNMGGTKSVLVTAIAAAYELPVEKVIHDLLVSSGTNTYAGAIPFVYQVTFNLATSVKVAKIGYGISSGEALKALMDSALYPQTNVVGAVADVYGTSQRSSIVDSLAANGYDTLASAVTFLGRKGYGLSDIARVGQEYYQLSAGETYAALDGFYNGDEINLAVTDVYNQTMTQTMLDALAAMGKPSFSDGIVEMRRLQYELSDIVLAGKDYYKLTAGQTTFALLESKQFATGNVVATVAEYYGKPIAQSVQDVLDESGIASIGDAAQLLRSMGYSLQDVADISRTYYGNSMQATIDALSALGFEDGAIIEWTVRNVYGEASGGTSESMTPIEALEEAGITDGNAAIDYLWNAGYSVPEIARFLKEFHGKSSVEAAGMLLANSSLDRLAVLYSMNGVYGSSYDEAMLDVFKRSGVFDSADTAALLLSGSGYRMSYIAETMKRSYGKTFAETKTILASLGLYSSSAIETTVSQIYDSVSMSSGTLQQVLELYGIKSREEAITFLKGQEVPVLDVVQYMKDAYGLDSDETMEILAPVYPGSELGLAIVKAFYSDSSIGYVTKVITGNSSTPSTVVNEMSGIFGDKQIVLALKVMFGLDALGVIDAISPAYMSPERVRAVVAEVFGEDPLFAYLKRMKDNGKTAYDIAVELNQRGLLELNPAGYLVDLLLQLGYDTDTILKVRYLYYNTGRLNEGTELEQGTQLAQLGVTSTKDIVTVLSKWTMLAYKAFYIVRAANPSATTEEIALAMKDYGYWSVADILGGVDAIGEKPSSLAPKFKKLGLTAREAMNYASDLPYTDMVRNLVANGYPISDYFRYLSLTGVNSGDTIAVLREAGYTAKELSVLMLPMNLGYYRMAKVLYDGGFTSIREVADALLAANCSKLWIIYYLDEIADWTIKGIAKELLDGGLLSLVELVGAIQYANGNRLDDAYLILREISTKERQAYYDALDSVSRKLLNNDDIAMIVMASTLRYANVSLTNAAEQLLNTEHVTDLMTAVKILVYAGFNVGDILETMWDVYREVIGITIIKSMALKAAASFIPDFKQYYDMAKLLYKVVNITTKVVEAAT